MKLEHPKSFQTMRMLSVILEQAQDVVLARQRARQLAGLVGYDIQDQTRIATAVSEMTRHVINHAGGGKIEFFIEGHAPQLFIVCINYQGAPTEALATPLYGPHPLTAEIEMGIAGARRLMDQFEVVSTPGQDTAVWLKKRLPRRAMPLTPQRLTILTEALMKQRLHDPLAEVLQQNQELLQTLSALRQRQEDLLRVNRVLEERDARLQLAFDTAQMGMWEWDINRNTIVWSAQLGPAFGLAPGDAPKTYEDFLNLVHPEDRPQVACAITRALTDGVEYAAEYRIVPPDGWVRWRLTKGHVQRDAAGRAVGLTGINMDITAQKQAELVQLQTHDTLEQRIQERTALLHVMQDITQAANESNSSAEALQYAVDRLCAFMHWPVGHVYLEVAPKAARWAPTAIWHLADAERFAAFRNAPQTVEMAAGEGMVGTVGACGKPVWNVEVATELNPRRRPTALAAGLKVGFAVPILVGAEVGGVLEFYANERLEPNTTLLDALTQMGTQLGRALERERAAIQVRHQQEALAQREKLAAMGSLLASVAHELNNPLAVILMQADLMREDASPALQAEGMAEIAQAAMRCERLVRQFLTLARQHEPERTEVDLHALLHDTLDLLSPALRVDTVTVALHLAEHLPSLWADPHQLQQVLVNLMTNAHQALRDTPPPRQMTLTTRWDAARQQVTLEVGDTGAGMPPAIQARIFEPFYTTKPPGVGTGLGLSLCQGIIEGHGGTIRCTSAPGHGTTFSIELPVGAAPAAAPTSAEQDVMPSPVQRATILLVDDEVSIARALSRLLRRDGHTIELATNGRVALTKLQERAYDLILSDLRMPDLDGPGLYHALSQNAPHLCQRFIFITGDTLTPEVQEFFAASGVPRLTKPFTVTEVRHMIQQVLHAGSAPAMPPES